MGSKPTGLAMAAASCLPLFATLVIAGDKHPYPAGALSAGEIMEQVYLVNHFRLFKNISIETKKKAVSVIIYRKPGKKPTFSTVKRYINNDYDDNVVEYKDLAIFTSGRLRGTGILTTGYVDADRSQSNMIWMPSVRKVRRFAQPAHDDSWGGTDFTYGDVTLRKPHQENHTLMERKIFGDCLQIMNLPDSQRSWHMKSLPHAPVCDHEQKEVFVIKSSRNDENDWWYDYRINYVDVNTFGDYRTDFFKGGKEIKRIYRDWGSLSHDDPRALFWKFWHGRNLITDHETMALVPKAAFRWNTRKKASLWSEKTLRKLRR